MANSFSNLRIWPPPSFQTLVPTRFNVPTRVNAQFGCVESKQNTAKEMGRKKEQYGFTKSAREAEGGGSENF